MALTAVLTGTPSHPELRLEFPWGARLPATTQPVQDWVKALPGRRWDKADACWYITATDRHPGKVLADAGIAVDYSEATGRLAGLDSLDSLWRPVVGQSREFPCNAIVYPRMAGFEAVSNRLGPGAVWEKDAQRFSIPLSDLLDQDRNLKRGLIPATPGLVDAARARLDVEGYPEHVALAAAELAASTGCDDDAPTVPNERTLELIDIVAEHTGYLPEWFGMSLFPYQLAGVYAAAGGHTLIADEPGLGKCLAPQTRVLANRAYTPIVDLWDEVAEDTDPRPDEDGIGEVIELGPRQIEVLRIDPETGVATRAWASHLYREHITAPVKTITTSHGSVITATMTHRFLTPIGWRTDFEPGELIAAPDDKGTYLGARWVEVTSVEYSDYEGWVYDLTVPDGHNYIAENLWCHNTRTSLAVAALRGARRIVVVCPPLVLTHWGRDSVAGLGPNMPAAPDPEPEGVASLAARRRKKKAAPKKKPEFPHWVCIIRPGRKIPDLPAEGVVVIADSLLAARPELLHDLIAWAPDVVIADEVHRLSSWSSLRGAAVRNLVWCSGAFSLPLTGTPMRSKPVELANIMAISGHLERVFGGASRYIDNVATQNKFKAWKPRKQRLPALGRKLNRDVWTRRNKKDVLKQLPGKWRSLLHVDIDQKAFKQAHADLYAKIAEWVDQQFADYGFVSDDAVAGFAKESIGLMSPLRVAAGVAKVKPAIEYVKDWLEKTTDEDEHGRPVYTRPLIVWAHHKEVLEALRGAATKDMAAEIIDGSTPSVRRQEIADRFQDGKVGVLFASITAAGFGLTLTRSSDELFVEQDWTPANISQAEDRCILEGEPVLTINGYKPIQEIAVGDLVMTHKGRFRPVSDVWSRGSRNSKGERRLRTELKYTGCQDPISTTSDHPILVRRRSGTVEWAEAGTILPGDEVATPRLRGEGVDSSHLLFPDRCRRWTLEEIETWSSCVDCGNVKVVARGRCDKHYYEFKTAWRAAHGPSSPLPKSERRPNGRYRPMPRRVELTPEFLSFCGLYVAEGFSTVDPSKGAFVSIAGHLDERHFLEAHGEYVRQAFGFNYTIASKTGTKGVEMRIYSEDLANWFLGMFGHGARNKSLPSWVFYLSRRQQEQFLMGYIAGDGHAKQVNKGATVDVSWGTASRSLDAQFGVLAAGLGYKPSSRLMKYADALSTSFVDGRTDEEFVWRRVHETRTRYLKRSEHVWDLTVVEDSSFVVNGIAVHNCYRIGQTEPVMITTLFSRETLDPSVRAVLKAKGQDLEQVLPGADNHVTKITAVLDEETGEYVEADDADDEVIASVRTEADIIRRIVEEIVEQRASAPRRARRAA